MDIWAERSKSLKIRNITLLLCRWEVTATLKVRKFSVALKANLALNCWKILLQHCIVSTSLNIKPRGVLHFKATIQTRDMFTSLIIHFIDLFYAFLGCLSYLLVNIQWRQQWMAATALVRDAEWLQAEWPWRWKTERVTENSMECCDVSSLLQHGAYELKTLGHYILPSGIHTVQQWFSHFGLECQKTRLVHHRGPGV